MGCNRMVVKKTQSARIKEIASDLNLSENLVKRVIEEYIEKLQCAVANGEDVEIRGIFQVKVREINGEMVPRGTVSPALKERIKRGYKKNAV